MLFVHAAHYETFTTYRIQSIHLAKLTYYTLVELNSQHDCLQIHIIGDITLIVC